MSAWEMVLWLIGHLTDKPMLFMDDSRSDWSGRLRQKAKKQSVLENETVGAFARFPVFTLFWCLQAGAWFARVDRSCPRGRQMWMVRRRVLRDLTGTELEDRLVKADMRLGTKVQVSIGPSA